MKKLVITFLIILGFALQTLAYDFQSGNLLYTIISIDPPRVSLDGHIDGENAQGELVIPETVEYEGGSFMVTRIGREAFKNCAGFTGQLVIPSTVDTIQSYAFERCRGFTGDFIIPNSVRYLGAGAFWWCTGFDGALVLPETITVIEPWTFEGCVGLSGTLNIPASVTRIKPAAFGYCTGFTGTLVIPESVVELSTPVPPVNGIRGAFDGCTGFTGLVLPESLRIIGGGNGGGCFAFCTGLTGELVIPDKVKEIGYMAFYACHGLTGELHLPDSLQSIGYEAFSLCDGFTGRLVFPNALESIGNGAFAGCSGFSDVELHHEVFYQNNFGGAVFTGWSIDSLELPEGWTTTGRYTFERCGNLRTVHLPESLTMIDISCFQECSALTDINLPTNLTVIEQSAFDGCSSLTNLELPANLNQLRACALRNCTSLTGELVVPDLVERIELLTFAGCTNLNRIVLGSSVNFIAEPAFEHTELSTLVLKSVTPPELKRMTAENAWHFATDIYITVPCGTLEAYQNAEGWSEFTNIHEGVTDALTVHSSDETAGTVGILKEATCEDRTVEVEALPNEGCAFMYWEADGERVSSENPYSFVLEEDTELVAYFSGTGVDEIGQKSFIYPSPSRETIIIEGIEPAEVQVYNALGQLVKTVQGTNAINVGTLPEGMYLLRITDKEGVSFVKRITVNK